MPANHSPDSLFGLRRHVGRFARVVACVGRTWFGPGDVFRPGALAVPLDVNLGLEVIRSLGRTSTDVVTSELSIDFTGARAAIGQTVLIEGAMIRADGKGALSSSRAATESGELLAVATAAVWFIPLRSAPEVTDRAPDLPPAPSLHLDEILAGELVHRPGALRLETVCPETITNARGTLQGGVATALGECLGAKLLGGANWVCQSLRSSFLRPVPVGSRIAVVALPRHRGRGFAVVDAEIVADGAPACLIRANYRRVTADVIGAAWRRPPS